MSTVKATTEDVLNFLKANPDWQVVDGKLHKTFQFRNFKIAFAFMTSVADYAEEHDHHPEWFNVYKTVKVDLTTHSVAGISQKDFELAKAMDVMASDVTRST